MTKKAGFCFTALMLVFLHCARGTADQNTCRGRPDALVVVDGAQKVECESTAGSYAVTYEVLEPYPAAATLSRIRSELSRLGWQPLAEDFLNPGVLSSHVRGWVSFEDATTAPATQAHQWYGQWEAASGDVVAFGLLYRSPLGGAAIPSTVGVSGRYLPCEMVNEQVRTLAPEKRRARKCRGVERR